MSFTDIEEKKLIKLVSEHPALYDPNDDDYHNHLLKETTWQTIGQALKKPGEDCKRKWKFIRDGYMRFKKRFRFDSNSTPPKNSKNKRHKLLLFLEESQAASSATEPEIQIEETDDTSQDYEAPYDFLEEKNFAFVNTDVVNHKVKREREFGESDSVKRAKVDNDRVDRDETIVRKREDDVDLFCRHIAEVLRGLPPVDKAKAKKHIGTIVSDYEIKAAQSISNASEVSLERQDD